MPTPAKTGTSDSGAVKRDTPATTEEATREFIDSLVRAGGQLLSIPVSMLPEESRGHLQQAGRELAQGLAVAARTLADNLDKAAQGTDSRSTESTGSAPRAG